MLKGAVTLKEGCALRGNMSPESSKGVSTAGGMVGRKGSDSMMQRDFLSGCERLKCRALRGILRQVTRAVFTTRGLSAEPESPGRRDD